MASPLARAGRSGHQAAAYGPMARTIRLRIIDRSAADTPGAGEFHSRSYRQLRGPMASGALAAGLCKDVLELARRRLGEHFAAGIGWPDNAGFDTSRGVDGCGLHHIALNDKFQQN